MRARQAAATAAANPACPAARDLGTPFARAWRKSIANLDASAPPTKPFGGGAVRREHDHWRGALSATRGAWLRAYEGEAARPCEQAVSALLAALSDTAEAPAGKHVLVA
jgi:hypothetical protein